MLTARRACAAAPSNGAPGDSPDACEQRTRDDSVGERADQAARSAFPRLAGADRRRELVPAPARPDEIGGGVGDPDQRQHQQHLAGASAHHGERRGHEHHEAGRDERRGARCAPHAAREPERHCHDPEERRRARNAMRANASTRMQREQPERRAGARRARRRPGRASRTGAPTPSPPTATTSAAAERPRARQRETAPRGETTISDRGGADARPAARAGDLGALGAVALPDLLAGAAEAPLAAAIRGDRRVERRGVEVRPQRVGEIELAVGELPQQEVADALLAAGADEKVGLGRVAHREVRRERGLRDRRRAGSSLRAAVQRLQDVPAAAVIGGDGEREAACSRR